jgi:uncharacterized pyridoxamine 5'-phosphate oxidase family protein
MSESGRTGQFIMNATSMLQATKGYWLPPVAGSSVTTDDDQLVLFFSKALWKQLEQTNKVEFDGIKYSLKQMPEDGQIMLKDNMVDALYLKSEQGHGIWLLNNPVFPLILKIRNNPEGVDAEITDVK